MLTTAKVSGKIARALVVLGLVGGGVVVGGAAPASAASCPSRVVLPAGVYGGELCRGNTWVGSFRVHTYPNSSRRHIIVADKAVNGLAFSVDVIATNDELTRYFDRDEGGNATHYDIWYPASSYSACQNFVQCVSFRVG
ncbi:hypothetical protein M1L60_26815 [Actinoplanes sp. TRM 88003]|uniref:Uncharacterized protein n=1 Tax=Paractinoplanes aksuensis TaxID=2939490 RepID=A0ABT1DTN1_9ACTN|nr:hypothetical protein [Actinoplanes aksuensis]MCO8274218.1 hypothetical protein [Actinoplanes aksuensis]